jgi:hypothetical protein
VGGGGKRKAKIKIGITGWEGCQAKGRKNMRGKLKQRNIRKI